MDAETQRQDPKANGLDASPRHRSVGRWLRHIHGHVRCAQLESIRALLAAVDAKDPYTRQHSINVARYSAQVGRRMRLPEPALETLQGAALLHDIGKIGVADAILNKPGPLSEEEFEGVKQHPRIAIEILGHLSFLADYRPIILHHHERFDGRGYPEGLSGEQIPIGARILAVTDAFDTMRSGRPYKRTMSLQDIRNELKRQAGGQFDPAVVNCALRWLDERSEKCVNRPMQSLSKGDIIQHSPKRRYY